MPFLISIDHPSTINGFDFNIFQPSPGIAGADHTVGHGFTTALTAEVTQGDRTTDGRCGGHVTWTTEAWDLWTFAEIYGYNNDSRAS